MRKLALAAAILLALSASAHAIILVGFGGSTCATQTNDQLQTVQDASTSFTDAAEQGQSFTAGASGTLYSIKLNVYYASTPDPAPTLTVRIGTSSNLSSSYLSEWTCAIGTSTGVQECVIPSGSRPTISSGTLYYFLIHSDTAGAYLRLNGSGGYADGQRYQDTSANWSGTAATGTDYYFITRMCD